jgi:HPt (histidine-containing phosphotransfer) domain-containing protein
MADDMRIIADEEKMEHPGWPGALPAHADRVALANLLDALEGDRAALVELIGDFLASYRSHLERISTAICDGDARHLEKSAHQFKGSLGIFCRSEPLSLTQSLIDMGERESLNQAPRTLELLEREMEQLVTGLRAFAGR